MTTDEAINDEARHLHECISRIQREYEMAAKPYVDRLIRLETMRTPRFTIPLDVWNEFSQYTKAVKD